MSETALWRVVATRLKPYGRLVRIENGVDLGTPDVVYALKRAGRVARGWLELKHRVDWPARERTAVNLPGLTLDQVLFAEQEALLGDGRCWMLLQVLNCYMLLDPGAVRGLYDCRYTAEQLRGAATVCHEGEFPTKDVLMALTK